MSVGRGRDTALGSMTDAAQYLGVAEANAPFLDALADLADEQDDIDVDVDVFQNREGTPFYRATVTYELDEGSTTREYCRQLPRESRFYDADTTGETRRGFLHKIGATALIGGLTLSTSTASPPYQRLRSELDALVADVRRVQAEELDTASIHLGNVNQADWPARELDEQHVVAALMENRSVNLDLVYLEEDLSRREAYHRIIEEFDNNAENLETYYGMKADPDRLPCTGQFDDVPCYEQFEARTAYELDRLGEPYNGFDADITTLDEDLLQHAAADLEGALATILPRDVDVNCRVRRVPTEDFETAFHAQLAEYDRDRSAFPLFLTTEKRGYAFDGYGTVNHSVVRVPTPLLLHEDSFAGFFHDNLLRFLLTHEAGHGVLKLPHSAYPHDYMSYDKEDRTLALLTGRDMSFSERNALFVESLFDGEITRTQDGWRYERGTVDRDVARRDAVTHMDAFLHGVMGFDEALPLQSYDPADDRYRYGWSVEEHDVSLEIEVDGFINELIVRDVNRGTGEVQEDRVILSGD